MSELANFPRLSSRSESAWLGGAGASIPLFGPGAGSLPTGPALCEAARRPATGGGRPPAARSVVSLLDQANHELIEAQWEPDPAQKFASAYLAALRAAAAMLALRGRSHRGRSRPASAWVLLRKNAPELEEWSGFFNAASSTNAAIRSGITRMLTQQYADDFVRKVGQFISIIEQAVPNAVA